MQAHEHWSPRLPAHALPIRSSLLTMQTTVASVAAPLVAQPGARPSAAPASVRAAAFRPARRALQRMARIQLRAVSQESGEWLGGSAAGGGGGCGLPRLHPILRASRCDRRCT